MNVSVIIPAYNAALTIERTLASLEAQTAGTWEAIVVDDGSTDGTADLVRRHAARDPRITLVSQDNRGEAGARNAGIEHAHHEWILFLDADDWIAPVHLERLTAALAADETLDAVFCQHARIAPDGTRVDDEYVAPTGDMFDTWARRSAFPVHACIVRRRLVEEAHGFDTSFARSTDWDFWQRVARTGAKFGAVRETLAFYRMRPDASSLDAPLLLRDGLRVLQHGHGPDNRVERPAPDHVHGLPANQFDSQAFYLLAWCAGLTIGRGEDARTLLASLDGHRFPDLAPDAVAQILHQSVILPTTRTPADWVALWPATREPIGEFLEALEAHTGASGLAAEATAFLLERIVRHSPDLADAFRRADARLETLATLHRELTERTALDARERTELVAGYEQRIGSYEERMVAYEARLAAYEARIAGYETRVAAYEAQLAAQAGVLAASEGAHEALGRLNAEHLVLGSSQEMRVGRFVLDRLHLRRPLGRCAALVRGAWQRAVNARLRFDALRSRQPRVIATICSNFPIYSQTFVHQELQSLVDAGHDVKVIFSRDDGKEALGGRFADIWRGRRRLVIDGGTQRRDLAHFQRRMPQRVDELVGMIAGRSGMTTDAVLAHPNVLQGFTFARMVEAYRPAYVHSYFFYDRSLMALVAAHLLGIPRGVSCYADHLLADYELKLVPLHLELCSVVIATSHRIREELLRLAPAVDPEKILVKPNAIDCERFPVADRSEPGPGEPFRLVSVCRIEPKKGLLDLVEAVAVLRTRGIDVEAHIVGEVDGWSEQSVRYKVDLDRRITELDLWSKVHLEGRHGRDGVLRFHGLAQLFVAPFVQTARGDKDGIPTALLEAMSTGLPAVATNAGSIGEVITSGVDGLMVPERDSLALASAIADLLLDAPRRLSMGDAAAATIRERFDVAACEGAFHRRVGELMSVAS